MSHNVIAFPRPADTTEAVSTPPPVFIEDMWQAPPEFMMKDHVRLTNQNWEAVIIGGRPDFGSKNQWLYTALIITGPHTGMIRAVFAESLELIESAAGGQA